MSTLSNKPGTAAQPHWYAVYTYPQAERKVFTQAQRLGVEAFLPLQQVIRQWSDRKKKLEVPLFSNYVFVKTTQQSRFNLFSIPELVKFVSFEGFPVAIPESQIEAIRKMVEGKVDVEEEVYSYEIGQKVKVVQGHLTGMEGSLVRKNGKSRFVIQLDFLQRALSVELPAHYLVSNEPAPVG